jgi:membrane protease YdiL (CAAX protease family)
MTVPTPDNRIPSSVFQESQLPPAPPPLVAPPDENPPWSLWEVAALGILTFIVALGLMVLIGSFVHRRFSPATPLIDSVRRVDVLLISQFLTYVLISGLMYGLVYTHSDAKVWDAIRWKWPRNWPAYALAGVALYICLIPLALLLPMPKNAPIDALFRTARDAYIASFFAVLIAPVFEEILFRGFLYPALARRLGMVPSVFLTALGFAIIHGAQLNNSWGPVLVIFLVGIALTTVRAVKKSVGASVLMHMAYNGTIFITAYIATSGFRHLEKFNQ